MEQQSNALFLLLDIQFLEASIENLLLYVNIHCKRQLSLCMHIPVIHLKFTKNFTS